MHRRHERALGAGFALALSLAAACRAPEPSPSPPPAAPPVAAHPAAPAPQRPLPLAPGITVEAVLKGGEFHIYRLDLPPDHFADLAVEQRGVDVRLRLTGPDGRPFPAVDSPNGTRGVEPLPLLGAAGPLKLEVRAPYAGAAPGRYAVRIGAVRPATDRDRARVAAERDFAAAESLRGKGDGESLRAAAAGAAQAAARFKELGAAGRTTDALYALGRVRDARGETEAALVAFQEALPGFRAAGDRGAQGRTLNSLGRLHNALGFPLKALACEHEALALYRSLGDLRGEATALNNLGKAQADLGRAEEALASYDQALALWRRLGLRVPEGLTLANRGSIFGALGETQRALDDLDQALPLLAGRREAAGAFDSRGFLRSQVGQTAAAAADLARALDLYRQAGDRRGEAVALNDLGLLRQSLGRKEGARGAYEAAVAAFHELGDHPNEAAALVNLGRLRVGDRDLAAAEAAFRRALPAFVAAGRPAGEASAWMGLAQVRRARGDLQGALRAAETGLARLEALRTQPGSLELRTAFFASYQNAFAFAVDAAMELHRREPAAGHDGHAFEVSERARARSFLDALARAGVDPRGSDPARRAREAAAGERLEAAEQRRTALVAAGAPAGRVARAELELRRGLAEIERLEAEARRAAPPAAAPRTLTLREVRRTVVDPETILLEYALGERRSFLWAVSASGLHSYELPPRKTLEDAARQAHALLSDSRRTLARAPAEASLAELSRLLLGAAAKELAGRRLLVVPDGALHLIPFGALADPAAPDLPLLARHEVVSVPSASSLAAIRRGAAGRGTAPAVVAVLADPVFDAADPRVTGRAGAARPPAGTSRRFSRLASSREEARTVLALAPPGERLAALDFAARREVVTSGALERFRILHFATHGVVDADHPELSGIALSMVDEGGRPRDGFLRSYEIYRLRLPADLVVLSACETALGKDVRGEGVVGLTRAFLHAGARRVLVSLWPVEDRATADLMRGFYEGLFRRGLPPAEALRQAQDALRRQPNRRAPHYWAGFVLQGEWR